MININTYNDDGSRVNKVQLSCHLSKLSEQHYITALYCNIMYLPSNQPVLGEVKQIRDIVLNGTSINRFSTGKTANIFRYIYKSVQQNAYTAQVFEERLYLRT